MLPKALRPVVASALLTGLPVLVLLGLEWRFVSQLRGASTTVLKQLSANSADAVAQRIERDFGWPAFNLLERVDHQDVRQLRFSGIANTVSRRLDRLRFVDRVFIWSRTRSARPEHAGCDSAGPTPVYFFPVQQHGEEGPESPPAVSCDPRVGAAVLDTGIRLANLRSSFTLAHEKVDGRAYQTVYHFLYDQTEARLGMAAFVGFTVDPVHVRERYFPQVIAEAAAQRRDPQLPALSLSIVDDRGVEVYRSGRSLAASYDAAVAFPFLFFDTQLLESLSPQRPDIPVWSVRSGYTDSDIATLVRREMMQQQALWALFGIAALAGVGLTARATWREVRLAQLKSEFMSSVSHELKTPLAKIQLFAETLESGRAKTPEKAQEYYRIIRGQALKLVYLIGVMLDFAKIEAGVRRYQLEELDLRPLLESALAMFQEELALREFRVETAFPDHEVPVRGNSEALQQLFGNLISNAIKYSIDDRFLSLGVRVAGREAVVTVTDHGIGIPRNERRKVFRKFYRVAQPSVPHVAGSGLGLAIVDHVARVHRGSVSVGSTPGATTFTVRLPLVVQEDPAS